MFHDFNQAKDNLISYLNSVADTLATIGDTACEKHLRVQIEDFRRQRFNIAVVGGIKRGKSTLLNTLLQQRDDTISPIDAAVCTGAIIRYLDLSQSDEADKTPHALIWIGDNDSPQRIEWEEIRDYVSEQHNSGNSRELTRIEVYGHFPMLKNCCLVDTPGDNACIDRHGEQVREFLPIADAVIMTILAGQPMSNNDHSMLQELSQKNPKNLFYVVTQMDNQRKNEIPLIINFVKSNLPAGSKVYPTACKPIYEALRNYESQEIVDKLSTEHGLTKFTADLEKFILANSEAGRDMTHRVRAMLTTARQRLQQQFDTNNELIKMHDIDISKLHETAQQLKNDLRELERDAKKHIRKFERAWEMAVNTSMRRLEFIGDEIQESVDRKVKQAGIFGSISNIWKFDSIVSECANRPLSRFYQETEERLAVVTEKFNEEMEESVRLFNKKIQSTLSIADKAVSGILGATLATCTTIGGTAAAEVITASVAVAQTNGVIAASGTLAKLGAWFGIGSASAGKAAAASALSTACTAAVGPVIAAGIALMIAKPLAQNYLQGKSGSAIDQKLQQAGNDLHKKIEQTKQLIIDACNLSVTERKEQIEEQLDATEEKIRNFSPDVRNKAEEENKHLSSLLAQSETLKLSYTL